MAETVKEARDCFEIGDTIVKLDPNGTLMVTSPGGMGGKPRTDRVTANVFAIEQVRFNARGDAVRAVTLFEAVKSLP